MNGEFDALRTGLFVGILLLLLLAERIWPKRHQTLPAWPRMGTNLGLIIVDTLIVRLLLPLTVIGFSLWTERQSWGIFHQLSLPMILEWIAALLLLDFAMYLQHRAAHHFQWFWRIHRVHHADPQFDTTTGVRFHPLEILLSTIYKMLLVAILGPSVIAVVLFEIILNATSLFTHANLAVTDPLDRKLRLLIVTPDVHRIHHSHLPNETDRNFGFNLTIWDRVFGTWQEQPEKAHQHMDIGLPEYTGKTPIHLAWCLKLPFSR